MANRGKNAPSGGEPSTAEIEAEVLREDTATKFHELALDALEFKQSFPRIVPARRPLTIRRALESVRRMGAGARKLELKVREWRRESCKLWERLIVRLAQIRADLPWIQRQMRDANQLIEPHCRAWVGVAADLTDRVMADCDAKMRMESVARVWHENEGSILRAQFLAISRVRRLAKRGSGSPGKQKIDALDIFQRTMKKNPGLSYQEICGAVDFECQRKKIPIPIPPKCHRHAHRTLLESINCVGCRAYMKSFLSDKRSGLDLPRPPRSKFPSKPSGKS